MKKILIALWLISSLAFAQPSQETKENSTPETIINNHLQKYGKQEFFTAIQVSIRNKDKINSYAVGTRAHDGKEAITSQDLFNIGSITKSFTAALALMAEAEGKIKLDSPLANYLKTYPHWDKLNLTGLLNMSTGIPNYSDSPTINYLFSNDIKKYWSTTDLINLIYAKNFNPPLKPGYFYSNTGYVLLDIILADQYKKSYATLLNEKILKPLNLKNTFYPVPNYPDEVMKRMVRGYGFNIYDNPELVGRDVTENNMSWAGAAGGLVANTEDVVHWVEHLFIDEKFLSAAQKEKMQTMVSLKTGEPIKVVDKNNPQGFGLGIAQAFDPNIGSFWMYEGKTLGYRALYMYVPCNQVIIAGFFNSVTNQDNDHAHNLLQELYSDLLDKNHNLNCGKLEQENKQSA